MSRKSSSSAQTPPKSGKPLARYWLPSDAKWGGFINIKLDNSDREAFAVWHEMRGGDFWNILDDLLGQGMKVGFAYDADNECYVCTLTGRLLETDDSRFCMTTRAGTWEESVALAVWKHERTGNGFYDSFRPRTGKLDNWG
jgi:hypothetical protein